MPHRLEGWKWRDFFVRHTVTHITLKKNSGQAVVKKDAERPLLSSGIFCFMTVMKMTAPSGYNNIVLNTFLS